MVLVNMWMYKWVVAGSEAGGQRNTGGSTVPTGKEMKGGMGLVGNPRAGIMVPIFGYLTVLIMIFAPFNILFKKERSMRKALFSGFKSEVTFADVILADILTSFARVFGDLAVSLCLMFLDRDGTNPDACYGSIVVPIMTSIPYLIRLRQCLSEYIESNYTTGRHLMNALKYSSAFPVIIVSAMQKSSKAASLKGLQYDGYFTDNSLFKLWLFFVALNSLYSFYWDIYHDWNLIQTYSVSSSPGTPPNGAIPMSDLSNQTNGGSGASNSATGSSHSSPLANGGGVKQQRLGMRSYLHYEYPSFYVMAVVLDFLLRTTWILKLVSNIQIEEYEGGVFTMECLEVLRRWIWVLFRMESEMVKRAGYTDADAIPFSHSGGVGGEAPMAGDGASNGDMIMMEEWQK
ncbi:protein-ER retention protein [Mortierella sp. NVP85]|nr:protein-ER retention protein [Mortierella sp. NVP85]